MKNAVVQGGVFIITQGDNIEAFFFADTSCKVSNNNTSLQVVYQGKPIFVASSDPNSPNYGNTFGGTDNIPQMFQDILDAMKAL